LDLVRHYRRTGELGARDRDRTPDAAPPEIPDGADAEELDRWCAFHEEVAALPVEEREVVSLLFYHGWSQAETAELFGVNVRTVQGHWQSAVTGLRQQVDEPLL